MLWYKLILFRNQSIFSDMQSKSTDRLLSTRECAFLKISSAQPLLAQFDAKCLNFLVTDIL